MKENKRLKRIINFGRRYYYRTIFKNKRSENYDRKLVDSDFIYIIIVGETGVGKDIIAKEIYKKAIEIKENMLKCWCYLSGELIERELFGYERGAFLGANASKSGILEDKRRNYLYRRYFKNGYKNTIKTFKSNRI